jgi:peptide/nickel transport system substrate-binding protein
MPESQLQVSIAEGIGPYKLLPSYPRAPVRFNEFADAVGMSINRQELNEVVTGGRSQVPLYSSMYLSNHPQSPPEDELHHFTDSPSGEPEKAKQVLQDAGWGYGENGNLRYPADKDLTPLWPKGEEPSADDFPCLDDIRG